MLEYWDKEHWEVKLSEDEKTTAGLMHGAAEGVRAGGRRVSRQLCFLEDKLFTVQANTLTNPVD